MRRGERMVPAACRLTLPDGGRIGGNMAGAPGGAPWRQRRSAPRISGCDLRPAESPRTIRRAPAESASSLKTSRPESSRIRSRAPDESACSSKTVSPESLSIWITARLAACAASYAQFRQLGLETRLGAVINMSLVRELGPVLAATMLAGRVGSAMAAELGTMRVTEQIDALTSMGANPIHYLVVPRFLGLLVSDSDADHHGRLHGRRGRLFYSIEFLGIDSTTTGTTRSSSCGIFDLFSGIFKSLFFGAAIAMVSCYRGFHCDPGAEGVGRAATAAFVYSFVVILVIDLFLGDDHYVGLLHVVAEGANCSDAVSLRPPRDGHCVEVRDVNVDVRAPACAARHHAARAARANAGDHRRKRLRQDRAAEDDDRSVRPTSGEVAMFDGRGPGHS